ncbi:hypothetical protein GGD81_003919 [Rhodobium orientis]|uniref:hypothetical protein n=1 Tax=Rhodobium orientis TaxID=34017 RepID=UPI0011B938A9|nr:hypothetical protein [Rhodobium orientis]MBB4304854.1 hypothetical protein [Rhodobium orientis]
MDTSPASIANQDGGAVKNISKMISIPKRSGESVEHGEHIVKNANELRRYFDFEINFQLIDMVFGGFFSSGFHLRCKNRLLSFFNGHPARSRNLGWFEFCAAQTFFLRLRVVPHYHRCVGRRETNDEHDTKSECAVDQRSFRLHRRNYRGYPLNARAERRQKRLKNRRLAKKPSIAENE